MHNTNYKTKRPLINLSVIFKKPDSTYLIFFVFSIALFLAVMFNIVTYIQFVRPLHGKKSKITPQKYRCKIYQTLKHSCRHKLITVTESLSIK